MGPVIIDDHTSDVRSMSAVVGKFPEWDFLGRCEDNCSEKFLELPRARVLWVKGEMQEEVFAGLFGFLR
jgi:hypothetical protein